MLHNSISKAIPAGTTRAQVAREAGISRVHLQRIMAGKQQPNIAIALRLSATLQTRIDLLFYLDEDGMRAGTGDANGQTRTAWKRDSAEFDALLRGNKPQFHPL
ncbi:MAG: helix-turn-helix transcriptional regulator [Acidobacteria bacterium]|nr:helix-turn-helix transcriptional regulator [Acidobacteriota bacterium]MCZ6752202.1 helix-turn-helix transcriptional regulator [Acidobacteriota bacterium]